MMFGPKRSAVLEDVSPQRARHLPSGAEVFNQARDRIGYALDGRTWSLFREQLVNGTAVYIDLDPTWDDGTPVTPAQQQQGADVITEVMRHWGDKIVEIVWPGQ